jgi:uncharacterized protein (TIGR02147 family)
MEKATSLQTKSHLTLPDLLKTELVRRCQKNSKYSLRSFAKSLDLSPAFVSKLLKGERAFTLRTIDRLSVKLALHPSQVEYYRAQLKRKKSSLKIGEVGFRQINLDHFQLISDWYHFAILELVTVEDFQNSPAWIAKQLGISVHQASDAMERLLRLGYLKTGPRGQVKLVEENSTIIGTEIALPAKQNQQKQILELAMQALVETPIDKRSQSACTMAIPSERLPEAKEIITEFRRKLTALMQRPGSRDSVYQLSVSFFPLTPTKKQER